MSHPVFPIGTKVRLHGKAKGEVVGTDYCRALIQFEEKYHCGFREYPAGSREWIVYGVLEPVAKDQP